MKQVRRKHLGYSFLAAVAALAFLAAGCGGDGDSSASGEDWQLEGLGTTLEEIESMARDEGEVTLSSGAAPTSPGPTFTAQTGCEVKTKDGAGSDDMVDQMATGVRRRLRVG